MHVPRRIELDSSLSLMLAQRIQNLNHKHTTGSPLSTNYYNVITYVNYVYTAINTPYQMQGKT